MNDYAAWTALTKEKSKAVADQDIQIKWGGEGGRSSRHWDNGGGPSLKKFFSAPRASVWFKNKGGARAPRAPPLDPLLQGTNKRELAHSLLVPI